MNKYFRKQIIILSVYFLIVLVVTAVVYFVSRPRPEATCFDGIRNQGEEKIDCGGPCPPCEKEREAIAVVSQKLIPVSENNFDFVAEVSNPNNLWGARTVGYLINVFDENNKNIFSKTGTFYILPQENKYIVESKIYLQEAASQVDFRITSTDWQRLSGFRDLALRIRDKRIYEEGEYTKISGIVFNNSNYDFDRVDLVGLIFDENKEIIAAGKTEVRTLLRGENRYFEIRWPKVWNFETVSFEIKAYTNIFSPENLMDVKKQQGL